MRNNRSFVIVILILLILVIGGIIGFFSMKNNNKVNNKRNDDFIQSDDSNDEEKIYNNNEDVVEDKEVSGVTFTNIKCYFDGENSNISYTITNTTDYIVKIENYKIIAYDTEGNKIKTINPYLGKELNPQEVYEDMISVTADFSKAHSIEIVLE